MYIRVTKTLGLGHYFWYGCLVLAVEVLGATTTLIYGAAQCSLVGDLPPMLLTEKLECPIMLSITQQCAQLLDSMLGRYSCDQLCLA